MTHISRHKLTPKIDNEIRSILKEIFVNLKTKDIEKVFSALITETEEVMIAKRLAIILMLSENFTYYDISRLLKVTNGTISGIHFAISQNSEISKFILHKLKSWSRKKLLKEILQEIGIGVIKVATKHAGGRIR